MMIIAITKNNTYQLSQLFFIFRPSDRRPFTTDESVLVIKVQVNPDEPVDELRLQTNENVDSFTVTIIQPNGNEVPVRNNKVYTV